MKSIIIQAPVLTQSGYGHHSTEYARWVIENPQHFQAFVRAVPWGSTPWMLNSSLKNGLVGKMMGKTSQPKQKCDIGLFVVLPNETNTETAHFNILATAVVETTICNPKWIDDINKMNLVIVPSTFSKNVIEETAKHFNKFVSTPIEVIPECLPDAFLNPENSYLNVDFASDFNFLVSGQITGQSPQSDRKNIFNTLKWLIETFDGNKNVGIVLKTNMGRNTIFDRNQTKKIIQKVTYEARKSEFPKIHLIHGNLTDKEMVGLYKHPKIKALVSLTRGEAWSRHTLEASACGLPIVATNWSGHLDFMNLGKFIKINCELRPVDGSLLSNKNIFVNGAKWAEPIEEDAKMKLEKFYKKADIPTEWAKELSEIIKNKYNFKETSKKYEEVFKKYNLL